MVVVVVEVVVVVAMIFREIFKRVRSVNRLTGSSVVEIIVIITIVEVVRDC